MAEILGLQYYKHKEKIELSKEKKFESQFCIKHSTSFLNIFIM